MPFWKRKPKEPGPPAHGPDFSNVDTREKALVMVQKGQLEPLYLMPLEFGGPKTIAEDRIEYECPMLSASTENTNPRNLGGQRVATERGNTRFDSSMPTQAP